MQCRLNLTFAALSLTFIIVDKAFLVFHAGGVIIGLQCDWLSLGKKCCSRMSGRLWGGKKYELS